MSRFPVVFRLPAFASWPSCARWGVGLPLRSAYRASAPGPQRGRRVPHERDTAGVGAPYTPGLRCSPDRLGVLRSAPPLPSGQSWTPLQQPICRASDDEASTGVYLRSPVRPSSSPVAPGWNGSPWACNLSFAPRRHKPTTHVRPGTGPRALARSCTFDFNCQSTSNGQLTHSCDLASQPALGLLRGLRPCPAPISRHRAFPGRHQQPGERGAFPTFTMIRLTGSEAGSTPTANPAGTRSIPPVTTPGYTSRARSEPP